MKKPSSSTWYLTLVIKDKQELVRPNMAGQKKGFLGRRDIKVRKQGI